jgi:acyl transferase domain-containing protein
LTIDRYTKIWANPLTSPAMPAIIAISGSNAADLKERLKKFTAEGRISSKAGDFNPGDFARLVMVVPEGSDLQGFLQNGIAFLDAATPDPACPPGIFYGEGKRDGKLAFLFPGQGSQYISMGRDLVTTFSEAKPVVDDFEQYFDDEKPLGSFIYPENPVDAADKTRVETLLRQTDIAQPAIGAISLVMMKLLALFNVFPAASAGHSFGELTALCAGKIISEKDFIHLSIWRGRLMAAACGADKGQMLAVKADPDTIGQMVKEHGIDAVLANRNGPEQGVLSGSSPEIEKALQVFKENRIRAMLLPVSAAFHSRHVADAAAGFREKIESAGISPAAIPVYSNKTALPYPTEEKEVRQLFSEHLVSPVNFMEQIRQMHSDGVRIFIEVGPKNALTGLVNSILKGFSFQAFSVDASSGKQGGMNDFAAVLGRLAAAGYPVDLRPWAGRMPS